MLVAEVFVADPESGPGLLGSVQQPDCVSLDLGMGGPGWCESGQAPYLLEACVSSFVRWESDIGSIGSPWKFPPGSSPFSLSLGGSPLWQPRKNPQGTFSTTLMSRTLQPF